MEKGKTIFIRKNGRIIPIKVKKGSALAESRDNVKSATDMGATAGAIAGLGASKLDTKRASGNLSILSKNTGSVFKNHGMKRGMKFLGKGISGAFGKKASIIEMGIGATLGIMGGSIIGSKMQSKTEAKRLQKKFGKPSVKNLKKAGRTGF